DGEGDIYLDAWDVGNASHSEIKAPSLPIFLNRLGVDVQTDQTSIGQTISDGYQVPTGIRAELDHGPRLEGGHNISNPL
ncbi:MAG TPA: hypothetical protein VLB85_01345, partial [Acidimicrobiia bacterium]|nr:hypothetical protein [Acidimicrobiia bacterium]